MNYRDTLYFRLKENIPNKVIPILHLYFTKRIPNQIMANHFNPNNTLTNEWWNKTHYYIYHYSKVCIFIEDALTTINNYMKKIDEINI